jgi:ABC-2 type transport system permease protein
MSAVSPNPARTVVLVAGRELKTKLRTKSFVVGTVVSVVLIGVFLLLQGTVFSNGNRSRIGLSGQATALAPQLTEAAGHLGNEVQVQDVADPAAGEQQVRNGDLDALVTGPPAALQVMVKDNLDTALRNTLDGLMQQQVLTSQLAEADLDAKKVLETTAQAQVKVTELEPRPEGYAQRLGIGLVIAFLLYMSLIVYGQMVAQGVVEEKSSRVVEILLATLRPWQLLVGKVLGLGVVGLIQFAAITVVGLAAGLATGAIAVSGAAIGAVFAGLLWYLLGYFFYATIFAAAGSLVSRQEDAQSVLAPANLVIVVGFVFGFNLLINDPSGSLATVMALLPPFAPILMPGLTALGLAPLWMQVGSIVFTLAGVALVSWLGGRIYANAVLRTGSRVRLKQALTNS